MLSTVFGKKMGQEGQTPYVYEGVPLQAILGKTHLTEIILSLGLLFGQRRK